MNVLFPVKRAQQAVIIWIKQVTENPKFERNQFAETILNLSHPRQQLLKENTALHLKSLEGINKGQLEN